MASRRVSGGEAQPKKGAMNLPGLTNMGTSVTRHAILLTLAIAAGVVAGLNWNPDITNWAYYGFLQYFLDPRAQIVNLTGAVALGFLAGFIHITAICYLPAALAAMPLVQAATGVRAWAKMALALTLGMMLVTGTFGGLVGGFGGTLTDVFGSRTLTAQVMKVGMATLGSLMIALALGELGFVRRLLPGPHFGSTSAIHVGDGSSSGYRRAAITGATIAATFGIICTRPTYLALLLYIAVVGSTPYGIVVLSAYGIGLAIPIVIGGRAFVVSSRSAKLADWLRNRLEGLRVAQGVLFALLGAMVLSYFGLRYVIPPG